MEVYFHILLHFEGTTKLEPKTRYYYSKPALDNMVAFERICSKLIIGLGVDIS